MTFKVIETFSGIGAQAKALERLKSKAILDYKIVSTVEWEIGALYAYDIIHNGKQNKNKYSGYSKEDLILQLSGLNLSSDGKNPLLQNSLNRMPIEQLKAIKYSIERNNNLVDISGVSAIDLPEANLLTYSFPCQDLSISSYWHGNFSGIDKKIQNRSGLLWQIERILKEYIEIDKPLPRYLLMENVSAIHGPLHINNFNLWKEELNNLGYENFDFDLDAKNFDIPQNRVRTFMISIYTKDLSELQKSKIKYHFSNTNLYKINTAPKIDEFLRLNYTNKQYLKEALESIPNNTPSRKKIRSNSRVLAEGTKTLNNIAKTITTKQDRNPNAGIIIHQLDLPENKADYRNLTPRETFLLMGFDENDYERLINSNFNISKTRKFLSNSKLLKLTGNSIVVTILEKIFTELAYVDKTLINKETNDLDTKLECIKI
ncbi:DNA (cytosine-5-)-methyltransferase [Staphylococcus lentus]|uniref:DNA (cytosine-5-)-methyltransferase n=1 Tax=Mammaliicoccus lentus TaxID=42858 RepID=UPI0018832FAF|nr:DNA (cytosine-5-)-methyltransferase [Mammaliicoccus lentus]MBF0841008.1 DNA (cytosine-5-)-methyltransferase [Mammaliicoccus lentus]